MPDPYKTYPCPLRCGIAAVLCVAGLGAAPAAPACVESWQSACQRRGNEQGGRERYGLFFERSVAHSSRVAIVVHGFNSTPAAARPMLQTARRRGVPCGFFAYPNDQPLAESAALLAAELAREKRSDPSRLFALVTHSMGALVARAVVEEARLDPGNVDRLVMVAPPNHGSVLAYYAAGADVWEHWLGRRTGSPWRRYRDSVTDGRGEAAVDLRPGSEFLRRLNCRHRNPNVRYTVLVGTGGGAGGGAVEWLRRRAVYSLRRLQARDKAAAVDRTLAELAETLGEHSDGVVPVRRARLAGVEDTVLLPFDHLGVAGRDANRGARAARRVIAARLSAGVE